MSEKWYPSNFGWRYLANEDGARVKPHWLWKIMIYLWILPSSLITVLKRKYGHTR